MTSTATPQHTGFLQELLERLRHARFRDGVFCPHCGGRHIQRWGTFAGRRRYRCMACARTFSDLTGTPLAYLKRVDRLPAFCAAMLASRPLRSTARRLGIDKDTAFRWRHRLLGALVASPPPSLRGHVHLAELRFAHSEKGRRDLDRPARRRGSIWWHEVPSVWAVLARDEQGRATGGVAGAGRPNVYDWLRILAPSVGPRRAGATTLVDRYGPLASAGRCAARLGSGYAHAKVTDIEAIGVHARALRWWLLRFRGVATKYLENYLRWHRFLGSTGADGAEPGARGDRLLQMVVGVGMGDGRMRPTTPGDRAYAGGSRGDGMILSAVDERPLSVRASPPGPVRRVAGAGPRAPRPQGTIGRGLSRKSPSYMLDTITVPLGRKG